MTHLETRISLKRTPKRLQVYWMRNISEFQRTPMALNCNWVERTHQRLQLSLLHPFVYVFVIFKFRINKPAKDCNSPSLTLAKAAAQPKSFSTWSKKCHKQKWFTDRNTVWYTTFKSVFFRLSLSNLEALLVQYF